MKILRVFVVILTAAGLIWCLLDPPTQNVLRTMYGTLPAPGGVPEIRYGHWFGRLAAILVAGAVCWFLTTLRAAPPPEEMMRLVPRDEPDRPQQESLFAEHSE